MTSPVTKLSRSAATAKDPQHHHEQHQEVDIERQGTLHRRGILVDARHPAILEALHVIRRHSSEEHHTGDADADAHERAVSEEEDLGEHHHDETEHAHEQQAGDARQISLGGHAVDGCTLDTWRDISIEHVDFLDRTLGFDDLDENYRSAVEKSRREYIRGLEKLGLTEIAPLVGDEFDDRLHHADGVMGKDEVKPGCVSGINEVGFATGNRIIRPAKVTLTPE